MFNLESLEESTSVMEGIHSIDNISHSLLCLLVHAVFKTILILALSRLAIVCVGIGVIFSEEAPRFNSCFTRVKLVWIRIVSNFIWKVINSLSGVAEFKLVKSVIDWFGSKVCKVIILSIVNHSMRQINQRRHSRISPAWSDVQNSLHQFLWLHILSINLHCVKAWHLSKIGSNTISNEKVSILTAIFIIEHSQVFPMVVTSQLNDNSISMLLDHFEVLVVIVFGP